MMFDPESPYCGQISMLNDQRETLGAALMYLGYSINDVDPAHLEEAKSLLIEQSACIKAYDSQTNDDLAGNGASMSGSILRRTVLCLVVAALLLPLASLALAGLLCECAGQ